MKSVKSYNLIVAVLMFSLLMFSCTQNAKTTNQTSKNSKVKNKIAKNKANKSFEKVERTEAEKAERMRKQKARSSAKVMTKDDARRSANNGATKAFGKLKGNNEALNQKGIKRMPIDGKSRVSFIGKKLTGKHNGYFPIKGGNLITSNKGELIGGDFQISLRDLQIVDLKGKSKVQLENHLKSKDFFNVDKNPLANFEIINITKMDEGGKMINIEGNLTMNGITKSILFPAQYKTFNGSFKASAKFTIDRTQWGIHYGNDKSLKDKFIKPEVELNIMVMSRYSK